VDQQPLKSEWDLLLTKFIDPDYQQTGIPYPVTGFLSNDPVTISVFHAVDSATAADATLADTTEFTDSIAAIGNSWYKLQEMSIIPLDTIAYFVKNNSGDIYKMQVTYFESGFSGLGRVGIRKMHADSNYWISDTLVMGSMYAAEEFYSMENGSAGRVFRDFWDIGFKSGVRTSSITANTTMGVELYAYPHGDTSAWYGSTAAGAVLETGADLNIYPVPARDHLFIRHDQPGGEPATITVFDMTGKQVLRHEGIWFQGNDAMLDISSLPSGVYVLRVRTLDTLSSGRFSKR
jgi:hypothetical protein